MSNRKLTLQGFFRKFGRFYRKITKSFVNRVLRYVLLYQRRGKLSTSGFILPTTVLLILVVALTVGALTFRAYNRNVQVIGEAQQRVIYNAATPAIDRARSKIEFLFDASKDTRLPSGVPSQATLEAMLLNNGTLPRSTKTGETFAKLEYKDPATGQKVDDAYTFPDETRIDINNDKKLDNAWYFRTDTNGDGKVDTQDSTVVYSIVLNTPEPQTGKSIATRMLEETNDAVKADNRWVRQAPLSVDGALGCARNANGGNAGPEGWFEDKTTTSKLRKNFQVDALVIPGNSNGTKVTLEFTQDRQLDRGNKWGAWFRHDLEIYPGAKSELNWNGAMHTEGSLIIGAASTEGTNPVNKFTAYLISSTSSCLFMPSASEITVTNRQDGKDNLLGLVVAGALQDNVSDGNDSSVIHLHSNNPKSDKVNLTPATDNLSDDAAKDVYRATIDPETVLLENGYKNVPDADNISNNDRSNRLKNADPDPKKQELSGLTKSGLPKRVFAEKANAPYVDDLYRADNLWGPKPKYGDEDIKKVPAGQYGKPIDSTNLAMLNDSVPLDDTDAANVGLDGYWERRARQRGLRLLVGQRLELGNLFTWYAPQNLNGDNYVANSNRILDQDKYEHEGDPLYPVTVKPYPVTSDGELSSIDLHRRTLRDNLSAVQSTAVYHHAAENIDYPVACLATTSHPGTFWTLRQAVNFRPFEFFGTDGKSNDSKTEPAINFFTGVGTNGWEFEPPMGSATKFTSAIEDETSELRLALQNLANFAGDHQKIGDTLKSGAFPPTQDADIHPYPALSMWGDYSNLKRALANLKAASNKFDKISIADRTYIQTAACTLGILAYNIDRIQKFDPSAVDGTNALNDTGRDTPKDTALMAKLGRDLWLLMDGKNDGAVSANPEVLPREQLGTYAQSGVYSPGGTYTATQYNARDYDGVTPEALIAALRQYLLSSPNGGKLSPDDPALTAEIRLAETIMLNYQIRRDRTFGFKRSPRFGQYAVLPSGMSAPVEMPTACDPDQFVFTGGTKGDATIKDDPLVAKSSTTLDEKNGLGSVTPLTSANFPTPRGGGTAKAELAQYRFALSRLCGTLDASGTQVLPKFPALYYLFPEVEGHDFYGDESADGFSHLQPKTGDYIEPYIADKYISDINAEFTKAKEVPFKRIDSTKVAGRAGYPSPSFTTSTCDVAKDSACPSRRPDDRDPAKPTGTSVRVFPIADYSVSKILLRPRSMSMTDWQLPLPSDKKPKDFTNKANFTPNIILKADKPGDALTPAPVPFLDRAFFDGRQLMLVRTLDIDLGMLRSSQVGTKKAVWLPQSGIVYAFREDAVREDAISRPACTTAGCEMDLRKPSAPKDPAVKPVNKNTLGTGENGISTKSIDHYIDPDRRLHGFRLRNGMQLKRSLEGTAIDAADNIRGLSFFTDQPVYIQGDFNHHQKGDDDKIGQTLEEFDASDLTQRLDDKYDNFYTRTKLDQDFAAPSKDRWRPSEILADSITILSNNFCDGSIADTFVRYESKAIVDVFNGVKDATYPIPDSVPMPDKTANLKNTATSRAYYGASGLFDPGCNSTDYTSFHNQNRPAFEIKDKGSRTRNGWTWVRENSRYDAIAERRPGGTSNAEHYVDITAPIKISRAGQPLVVRPRETNPNSGSDPDAKVSKSSPLPPVPYNLLDKRTYFGYGEDVSDDGVYVKYNTKNDFRDDNLIDAAETRVNAIIVSGINPSRPNQGYGGLQNFPRFLENWRNVQMFFSGSLIQLSYANYATAPFELEELEEPLSSWSTDKVTPSDPGGQNIMYFRAPVRRWGYDVGLQFAPAGPAAARFVTQSKDRTEYYVEPPASDPYIANLCEAVKAELKLNTSCPKK